jgi:hypothetical protein
MRGEATHGTAEMRGVARGTADLMEMCGWKGPTRTWTAAGRRQNPSGCRSQSPPTSDGEENVSRGDINESV